MTMKKMKFWSTMLLVMLVMPMMVACGGDDGGSGNNNGQWTLVDGVNVNKRKLLTLDLYYTDTRIGLYQMTYDSKGRLTRIDFKDYTSSEKKCGLTIDYDLCLIEYLAGNKLRYDSQTNAYFQEPVYVKSLFALNDRGFVSQIANCECTYNSDGYLTGVKTIGDFWSLVYNNGDVAKAMVERFKNGNIDLYYVYYGDKTNEGELYVTCKEFNFGSGEKFSRSVMTMIAYHAGLFGNITKHCTMLPNSADAKTFLEMSYLDAYNRINEDLTFTCKFTFDE